MPEWTEVVNFGVPMTILACVAWAAWKFGWYAVYRVFGSEEKNTRGIAGEWVDSELRWRGTLTERLETQQVACSQHVDTLHTLNQILIDQQQIGIIAKDQATVAAKAAIDATAVLQSIDDTLDSRTVILNQTNHDVDRLKRAASKACEICQVIAEKQGEPKVVEHCKAIQSILASASGDDLDVGGVAKKSK
jgi:hypothetical protein